MKLSDALRDHSRFAQPAVPDLRAIETAVQRVHDRWPDVDVPADSRERETLAQRLKDRVARNDWADARISFVLAAAAAVLDAERCTRADLEDARSFLFAEVRASRSETFLAGMMRTHLECFAEQSAHSRALAQALDAARPRMNASNQQLLEEVPEILDSTRGPQVLAGRMKQMSDPFVELVQAGLRNPHGAGFMDQAHVALSTLVQSGLDTKERVDWYLKWLNPPGREPRMQGAKWAIQALTHPWLEETPPEELQSHLVESLIEMYGDPRIKDGGVWVGVDSAHMQVIYRWLTREDMRFFTGVVDAAQQNAMWPKRRDFWLQLFNEKLIDAAWVAFSAEATRYARNHLMRQDARNADTRFGYQRARQNTSLLIMQIGNKVMVDGCHNYKTHVFDKSDPMAPKLYREGYDCDEIMRASPAAKPHGHGDLLPWKRWVRDMINADVGRSKRKTPYSEVFRPCAPVARYTPPPRPNALPPLPDAPSERFEVLFRHATRIEAFVLAHPDLSRNWALRDAVQTLKSRKPDIGGEQLDRLQQIYEEMRWVSL